MKKKLKIMSLFAGCGGMDLGFLMAEHPKLAYELVWANDFEKTACKTFEKNFKHKILHISKNLIEVTLKSSIDLENTPGVIAYLSSLLAENNINIIEIMSTYTDTIIVLEEKDMAKVIQLLRF